MKKNKNKYIKYGIISFLVFFLFLNFLLKLFGFISRFDFVNYGPFTWNEIFHLLPKTIIISLAISIVMVYLNIKAQKSNDKQITSASKRIAEREQQGKEQDNLVDEIVKEVMKESEE